MGPDTRLAVYGTLAPGKPNEHILAPIGGSWRSGSVRRRLVEAGWGASMGFPGIVLDPNAPQVEVQLFEADNLAHHWEQLDAFEGPGYRRAMVDVSVDNGVVEAHIYVLANL